MFKSSSVVQQHLEVKFLGMVRLLSKVLMMILVALQKGSWNWDEGSVGKVFVLQR